MKLSHIGKIPLLLPGELLTNSWGDASKLKIPEKDSLTKFNIDKSWAIDEKAFYRTDVNIETQGT